MKYEFSPSWSFNQMLLVSVFAHLLLMTVIMFLPKTKTPPPVEVVAWNVDLISEPVGRLEKINPGKAKEEGPQKEEKPASTSKPTPKKPKVAAKELQTPEQKPNIEKKEPVVEPPPVKIEAPVIKPPLPKKIVVASIPAVPKPDPIVEVPVLPELTMPKLPVRERSPEVHKLSFSTPKILRSKPQPKTLPKPRNSIAFSDSGVAQELDQLAKLETSARRKSFAAPSEKLITEESFKALDRLRGSSGKVIKANIVPLPMENPLEGFDRLAMQGKATATRPKLVTGKDATLIRDLEFDSLSKKRRDIEKQPQTKLASARLRNHTTQAQLDAIANAQPPSPEFETAPTQPDKAYQRIAKKVEKLKSRKPSVLVDIRPTASDLLRDHVSVTSSRQVETKKAFKSAIREMPTNIQDEKLAVSQSKTLAEKMVRQNKSAVSPRKTVIGKTAIPTGRPQVASIPPAKKSGTSKTAEPARGSLVPQAPPREDKRGAEVLSLYAGFIREKVLSNWKNPLGAEQKQVLVSFYLYPGGNVDKPYVEKSSGNPQLDALALRAITDSEPFPKFPSELKQPNLHISIHFKYVYLQD